MKFNQILGLLILVGVSVSWAHKKHRHHKSHVHGSAELMVSFEGKLGVLEFKSPSESILGFEHAASSEAEKAKISEETSYFEKEIGKILQFPADLGCRFQKNEIGQVFEKNDAQKKKKDHHEGEHSDFVAKFAIECQQSVEGALVQFDFSKWPKLKNVKVTFLAGALQKSLKMKGLKDQLLIK